MQELSPKVANWIYNVLQPQYSHKQLAYTHIYQFLQVYLNHKSRSSRFKIRTNVYTSPSTGQADLLIELVGSVKIQPSSASPKTIALPVSIWLPLNYPFADRYDETSASEINGVPLVFISAPGAASASADSIDWLLKPGNHIDSQGRFYHPYLSSWFSECGDQAALSRFNIIELVSVLKSTFATAPPLAAVPQSPSVQSQPSPAQQLNIFPQKPAKIPLGIPNIDLVSQKPAKIPLGTPITQDVSVSSYGSPKSTYAAASEVPATISSTSAASEVPATNLSTPELHREYTGPPLPMKPRVRSPPTASSTTPTSVPLKYQAPLPLPHQLTSNDSLSSGVAHPRDSRQEQGTAISQQEPQQADPPSQSTSRTQQKRTPVEDLMDKDEGQAALAQQQTGSISPQTLQQLSQQINQLLDESDPASINHHLGQINQNTAKVEALYDQLQHHTTQAKANQDILRNHITYLTEQVSQITASNQQLVSLDTLNAQQQEAVFTNPRNSVALDDIVTADSALVHQLYDVVSEIKANKDTIHLIGGGFANTAELINDTNADECVKTIRNLGRDTFWLELIKHEIASTMGLSH